MTEIGLNSFVQLLVRDLIRDSAFVGAVAYGRDDRGPAKVKRLAEFEEPVLALGRSLVLLVDSVDNKLEQSTIEENARKSSP